MASYHGSKYHNGWSWRKYFSSFVQNEWFPWKKCRNVARCFAAMFRKWCKILIYLVTKKLRYPVMLFPLYQITEAHLGYSHCRLTVFSFFLYPASNGVWWMLVVVPLAFGKPVWLLKFFNSQLHPAMDIFTKRWCFGKGDLPLVSLLIFGYDTFLDVLVPMAVTSHF